MKDARGTRRTLEQLRDPNLYAEVLALIPIF